MCLCGTYLLYMCLCEFVTDIATEAFYQASGSLKKPLCSQNYRHALLSYGKILLIWLFKLTGIGYNCWFYSCALLCLYCWWAAQSKPRNIILYLLSIKIYRLFKLDLLKTSKNCFKINENSNLWYNPCFDLFPLKLERICLSAAPGYNLNTHLKLSLKYLFCLLSYN